MSSSHPAQAKARAHPNIALAKYWGKRDVDQNIPATSSVALTLGALHTTTEVVVAQDDQLDLGEDVSDASRVTRWLEQLRGEFDIPKLHVHSRSNFPSSTGLASSASGFAALITAIDSACDLDLSITEQCEWARRGSASAARSIHGGFVAMSVTDQNPKVWQVMTENDWSLCVVIAITSSAPKLVSSSQGMNRSRETSPYYEAWLKQSELNFTDALEAIHQKDFEALGQVAESSCRQMHALMLSSEPALRYWNEVTLSCISCVESLQQKDLPVFYTIDAGAQVKAVCLLKDREEVQSALLAVPGVNQLMASTIGGAARVLS